MNKEAILGVVRHILTFGGGFVVAYGIGNTEMANDAIGAIMTLVGIAWSIYDKKSTATPAA